MTDPHAQAIRAEGVRAQYDNIPGSCISSVAMGTIVVAVLNQYLVPHFWGPWLALMYALAAGRWWLWRRYREAGPQPAELPRWGRFAALGSLASGGLWGLGGVLGFIGSPDTMSLILVPMIIMLGAVATFAGASYLPAFYTFFYAAALPAIATFFFHEGMASRLTGIAFLCYVPLVTYFVHRRHRAFIESTRLRFENLDLLAALKVEKAAAEEANLAKSRFLAVASHDLRQPMHALSLFIESLSRSRLPERETALLVHMRKSADAMESLFDALLDVSRLDAGIVEPRAIHFRLRPLLERLQEEFEPLARARGLALRLRAADVTAHTDPVLLNRIVSNLLANAVRYGAREGILLAARRRGAAIALEVWDTGVGIEADERERIFREFYQVGNPERDRSKGLGLGLAIVERLVRLLQLGIELRSRPGRGSMFRVRVPLGDPQLSEASARDAAAPLSPISGRFVLVIDDEPAVREAMRAMLTGWGCGVLTAGGGAEVKASLSGERRVPDLVICDYRLRGGENGIDVIEDLRGEYNDDIPGLIVTGDTLPSLLQEARDRGLPMLHKPINPAKLRAMIGALTQGRAGA